MEKEKNLAVWTGHDEPDNKGFTNLIKYAQENPELEIKAFGKFKKYTNSNTPSNLTLMGEVEQTEFAEWLKRARYVIALPNWLEPTGRSVMEGLMCGCTLIVNDKIGFLYEDIDFDNYLQVKKAVKTEYKFWNLIGEVIQ
jgi:glycosyltransferase involved in cell wall biosynthesis